MTTIHDISLAFRPSIRAVAIFLLLAFVMIGCAQESPEVESEPESEAESEAAAPETPDVEAEIIDAAELGDLADQVMAGRDYSLGSCSVRMNAPAPCVDVRGKTATGVAPGCSHDNCTTAKANARANLLTGIPNACGAYIDCGAPCRCIQKRAAD